MLRKLSLSCNGVTTLTKVTGPVPTQIGSEGSTDSTRIRSNNLTRWHKFSLSTSNLSVPTSSLAPSKAACQKLCLCDARPPIGCYFR